MKAIADKRKPKQKSNIPYRLKSAIENHSTGQHREETASNESASEQTQQAITEMVYRASQIPPQIRYAISKHKRKVVEGKRTIEEQQSTTAPGQESQAQETPPPEQAPQTRKTDSPTQDVQVHGPPSPQEQAKHHAQKEAAKINRGNPPGEIPLPDQLPTASEYSTTPNDQSIMPQVSTQSSGETLPPNAGNTLELKEPPSISLSESGQRKIPPSRGTNAVTKEHTIDCSSPKQKPYTTFKTKQSIEIQAASKHIRPEKSAPVTVKRTIAQRTVELGRIRFKRNVQKQTIQRTQNIPKTTGAILKKVGTAAGHATKAVIGWLIGFVGGVGLVAILCLVLLVAAVAASPFGIFFANEPSTNTIPLSSAVAQINMELNTRLMELQDGEYETIEIHGSPPEWTEVIAVFAAHIAGAEDGMDVALLDSARVELLRDTFWDMCTITSEVETAEVPTSDGTAPTEEPEETLHITISAKSTEDMRTTYGFTVFQNKALDMLLAEESRINAMVGSLSIAQADALDVLSNLPADLSPERRAVVQQALMLVGKVNYFWGGKSLVIGWDSRWGQLTRVSAAGSQTTGTYRPYGLDCSGFADWVFYNVSDGAYILGHGGGAAAQHRYCANISWANAQPGDLAFYPEDDHVGIVGGWDENGNILIIHCSRGHDNVVITGKRGFTSVSRPNYYSE